MQYLNISRQVIRDKWTMGRCRPYPDAAGCRWPRLNGKIDNILPNFFLWDSNETLNFKFVYNKWKNTRCKKTLNKQTKTQRNKVTEKHVFTSVKNSLNFSGMPPLPHLPMEECMGWGRKTYKHFKCRCETFVYASMQLLSLETTIHHRYYSQLPDQTSGSTFLQLS